MGDIIHINFPEEKKARKREKIMRELYGNTLKKIKRLLLTATARKWRGNDYDSPEGA